MSSTLRRRTLIVPVCAALLGGSLVGFAAGDEPGDPAPLVAAAELQRIPLPAGSPERGRAGLERSALRLAAALDAVPTRADGEESTRYCPADRLQVQWSAPAEGEYEVGGHVEPVGPAPADATTQVNGIVVCTGASYAYMGFEARWTGTQWSVASVPALSDEHDLEEAHEGEAHEGEAHEQHEEPSRGGAAHTHADREPAHAHAAPAAPVPHRPAASAARGFSVPPVSGIDPYAPYDPQRLCDPVAKPGTLALRDLLLRTYPGTRSLGISRTCTARGVSEHKEGRAFDWGVNVGVPAERAAAESVLAQLMATDSTGHRHALARRLGVMYVIWNRQIWSAYSADRGWRPYSGANAHTDHVHLSLSWAGAMGRTSYWSGANATLLQVDPELRLVDGPSGAGGTAAAPVDGGRAAGLPPARREREDDREARADRPRHERGRGGDDVAEQPGIELAERPRGRRPKDDRPHEQRSEAEAAPVTAALAQPAPVQVQVHESPAPQPVRAPKPARVPKAERPAKPARVAKAVRVPKAERPAKPVREKPAKPVREKSSGDGKGRG